MNEAMVWYIKKNDFFELEIDRLVLECKDYKLTRLSGGAMQLTSGNLSQIQYADTIILVDNVEDRTITLNVDGYETVTSKKWINEYLPKDFRLIQYKYEWFILKGFYSIKNKTELEAGLEDWTILEYNDCMTFNY